ncbi:KGK family protein [Calothrix sp. FACHB-1219]|uniref:KGK domain-containing protein n=1 Tax=unclassified Calothrix TaxID=2619626 RepID=UPI0016897959|nr:MULTISPECIES: KGK domain-containing protein [unclassified Calothrix]MBD2206724.1 KGK family protein [Calothrix sp. FACHB-168]MBD2219714.1 KGK family protein [Calothrix sp. FACHB-1219]
MSNNFITLDCDDDIILIATDSFTISRLKELVIKGIREKEPLNCGNNTTIRTSSFIGHFQTFKIYEQYITIDEIQFKVVKECQLLKIGSQGWQPGKITIELSISPTGKTQDNVKLKFCPDQPVEPESPLDDMRKMMQAI